MIVPEMFPTQIYPCVFFITSGDDAGKWFWSCDPPALCYLGAGPQLWLSRIQ